MPSEEEKTTPQETRKNFYKNIEILNMYNTLLKVDTESKYMDFGVRLKNKKNFSLLKEQFISINEVLDEIGERLGRKSKDGRLYIMEYKGDDGEEIDNTEVSHKERSKILEGETEIIFTPVEITVTTDPVTKKTDCMGIQINSIQMNILEPIFTFIAED